MKKYLLMSIAGLIFLNGFVSNDVSAQSLKSIKVEVKFDFRVGDKIYPAGVYRLESVSQSSDNILRLSEVKKDTQQLLFGHAAYTVKEQLPKLIFQKIGEEYYLTSIFMTNGNWGFSIRPSRRQIESRKSLASTKLVEVLPKD